MWRRVLAVMLAVHGAIHTMGVVAAYDWARIEGLSGDATLPVPIGGVEAYASLWLVATIAFAAAAAAVWTHRSWALEATTVAAAISTVPVAIWWADAWRGLVVNVLLVAAVWILDRRHAAG